VKLVKVGDRIVNMALAIEAHRYDDDGVQLAFAVPCFDTADLRRFKGEEAAALWRWLEAHAEAVEVELVEPVAAGLG